jgi:hypothetical protein
VPFVPTIAMLLFSLAIVLILRRTTTMKHPIIERIDARFGGLRDEQ